MPDSRYLLLVHSDICMPIQIKDAKGNGDCAESDCITGGSGSLRAVLVPVSVMSLLMSFAFVF